MCAGQVKSGLYDGAWFTNYNDTTFVTISQILMEWGECFIQSDFDFGLGGELHDIYYPKHSSYKDLEMDSSNTFSEIRGHCSYTASVNQIHLE